MRDIVISNKFILHREFSVVINYVENVGVSMNQIGFHYIFVCTVMNILSLEREKEWWQNSV